MQNQSYKLRSGVAGFLRLPDGGTMEVTIPIGTVVAVLCAPTVGNAFVRVQYGEHTCAVPMRELQKCSLPVGAFGYATRSAEGEA